MTQANSKQMVLEVESGRLIFTDTGNALEPLLPLNKYLSWIQCDDSSDEYKAVSSSECKVEADIFPRDFYYISGMQFKCYLQFIDSQLVLIGLKNADSVFEKALFIWATEKDRKETHDAWVAQNIGNRLVWPWGFIESYYDEVRWGATIFIHYNTLKASEIIKKQEASMQAQEKKYKIKEYPELPQGMILDNLNKPAVLVEFVQKLKGDRRLKSLYLCTNAMWQKFFEENADALNLSENVDRKLNDLWQVSVYFTKEEWPQLFIGIKKMEALLL